mmetsp:Transcript_2069/g.3192  ORF Transcript_2069/g.3192 Transcript_2069/m.3192 type:complete len:84 (+) Transcript_2069:333-584(+)
MAYRTTDRTDTPTSTTKMIFFLSFKRNEAIIVDNDSTHTTMPHDTVYRAAAQGAVQEESQEALWNHPTDEDTETILAKTRKPH